jgi:hypothetical protein
MPKGVEKMLSLKQIKEDRELVNDIDWDMTPEEAVRLYLEWGNNWSGGITSVKSKSDVSYYFVMNTWGNAPIIYLVKRNSDEAVDLAEIKAPDNLVDDFYKVKKGVYAVEEKVKHWLKQELDAFSYN